MTRSKKADGDSFLGTRWALRCLALLWLASMVVFEGAVRCVEGRYVRGSETGDDERVCRSEQRSVNLEHLT